MIAYIDAHRERFGVDPICRALQIAPRSYYAAKARPSSPRSVRDEQLKPGDRARAPKQQLNREGTRGRSLHG